MLHYLTRTSLSGPFHRPALRVRYIGRDALEQTTPVMRVAIKSICAPWKVEDLQRVQFPPGELGRSSQ